LVLNQKPKDKITTHHRHVISYRKEEEFFFYWGGNAEFFMEDAFFGYTMPNLRQIWLVLLLVIFYPNTLLPYRIRTEELLLPTYSTQLK
jgi:hypothetical protein